MVGGTAETMNILSLGAGVNTMALLILRKEGKVEFDTAVFADTGGEHPETYDYLENTMKPLCQEMGVKFFVVKRDGDTLYDAYFKRKIIATRTYSHCKDNFKIRPLRKFVRENFGKEQVIFIMGFCKGEEHREENFCHLGHKSPLIELGIDREGCKRIIQDAGYPLPIKSGCFFCPNTKVHNWKWLHRTHPDLFQKALALEKNCRRYPEITIHQGATLEKVISKTELCDWQDTSCGLCEVE